MKIRMQVEYEGYTNEKHTKRKNVLRVSKSLEKYNNYVVRGILVDFFFFFFCGFW